MRKRSMDGMASIKSKQSPSPSRLEIGGEDDAEPWSDMQVRHSQEVGGTSLIERGLNFARSTRHS